MDDHPPIAARGAIEALRAGVPNRAAIRLLGERDGALGNSFLDSLGHGARGLDQGRQAEGSLVWGGFGAGKSHLLELHARTCAGTKFRRQPRAGQQGNYDVRSDTAIRRSDPCRGGSRRERRCDDRCAIANSNPRRSHTTASRNGRRTSSASLRVAVHGVRRGALVDSAPRP